MNVSSVSAGDMVAAAKMQGGQLLCAEKKSIKVCKNVINCLLLCPDKVVYAETTVAHAVLSGMQYYHQDWAHSAAHVIVPPLRLDPNTPGYLMGLLAKYVCCIRVRILNSNVLQTHLICFQ